MRRGWVLGLVLTLTAGASAQLGIPRAPAPPARFSSVTVFPMATRAGGAYNFQGVAVPTGVQGLQVTVDVSQATDPLPTLTTILEGSLDGGTSWMPAGAFERLAGTKGLNKLGQPLTELTPAFYNSTFWAATANPNRQLRGLASLGGTMRFAMTVTPL